MGKETVFFLFLWHFHLFEVILPGKKRFEIIKLKFMLKVVTSSTFLMNQNLEENLYNTIRGVQS